jgi:hypothetical protein
MNKFLYFANATDDALLIPASGVSAIDVTGAAQIQIYYKDITDAAGGSVIVNITSGKCKEFLKALGKAIVNTRRVVIVVADDVEGEYFTTQDSSGTAVAATTCGTIALT